MGIRGLVAIGAVASAFYLVTASPAAAACCDQPTKACCETPNMTCCDTNDPVAEAVLIPQPPAPRPVREAMSVWFQRPVKVGTLVLFGKYIIEHDNARMARGEPCTYIYAAENRQRPVVTFHCEHLDRPRGAQASVTVRPLNETNSRQEFREFQFAGELGAHGFPTSR